MRNEGPESLSSLQKVTQLKRGWTSPQAPLSPSFSSLLLYPHCPRKDTHSLDSRGEWDLLQVGRRIGLYESPSLYPTVDHCQL